MQLALPLSGVGSGFSRTDEVIFVRHPKARRYIIRVVADGTVRVTVPRWGSKHEAARFAAREHAWIERERRRVRVDNLAGCSHLHATDPAALARARKELPARLLELAAHHGLKVS